MLIKKLLIIAVLACIAVVALLHVISAQNKPNPFSPYTDMDFDIKANKRTTIELYKIDGDKLFTLFDNVLSRDQKITFYSQPDFWEGEKGDYDYTLSLPFPNITSGAFFFKYITTDTTYIRKFVYMK